MTITQMLQLISTDKKPWNQLTKQEQKEFDVFIVNKMLATNQDYVELVNIMQLHHNMSKEQSYVMFLRLLPKKKIYIDYIKAKTEKVNKDLLSILSKHYEISNYNARLYYNGMGKDKITELLVKLGYDDKQIAKLFK
jgi:hypothetical protein